MNEINKKFIEPVGIGLMLETLRENTSLVARRFSSRGTFVRFDTNIQKYVRVYPLQENYFATIKDTFTPTSDDMTGTDWIILPWEDVKDLHGYYQDTMNHVEKVRDNLRFITDELSQRGKNHDYSKFTKEEFDVMKKTFPELRSTTYGSPEYKELLERIRPALDYHYARNDHHPEHHPNGVNGMNLMQVVEMLCDWKAAAERHADGDPFNSLTNNKNRFRISDQLHQILWNTLTYWKEEEIKTNIAKQGKENGVE